MVSTHPHSPTAIESGGVRRDTCPVCASTSIHLSFRLEGAEVHRCVGCGLMFLNPQPTDAELAEIYTADYFLGAGSEEARADAAAMKRATAREYLAQIARYRGRHGGRLLELGCGDGDFMLEAHLLGYKVCGIEYSNAACDEVRKRLPEAEVHRGELANSSFDPASFDLVALSDVIEHVRDPMAVLTRIHELLKPGGALFIATPSLDSWSAKLLGRKWMEWKKEHLTYFNTDTLQLALAKTGFTDLQAEPNFKVLTFDYVVRHFERYPVPGWTPALSFLRKITPSRIARKNRRIVASGVAVMARTNLTTL